MNRDNEKWVIGIMVSVTLIKFMLMVYCRRFENELVRAYAQDHLFDVITNSVGLVSTILAVRYKWWIDPVGAITVSIQTYQTIIASYLFSSFFFLFYYNIQLL